MYVSRWPQSALSFLYFRIVCNLPPFWHHKSSVGRVLPYCSNEEYSPNALIFGCGQS